MDFWQFPTKISDKVKITARNFKNQKRGFTKQNNNIILKQNIFMQWKA